MPDRKFCEQPCPSYDYDEDGGFILGNLVGLPIAAAFLIAWWLR
jgi:hypothetical protein